MAKQSTKQSSASSTTATTTASSVVGSRAAAELLRLVFCVAGIYFFFFAWALLQERITSAAYVTDDGTKLKFKAIAVLNLVQAACSAVIALTALKVGGYTPCQLKHRPFVKAAISNTLASLCGYSSLKFVEYLFLVIGKATKLVPVMAFNFVMNKHKFTTFQVVAVLFISAGMVSFKVYDPKVKGSSQGIIDVNTAIGFSLILANLAFDGFTSATQDRVFRDARDRAATKALKDGEEEEEDPTLDVSSFDMMYRVNLWSTFLLFGWVAVSYVVFGPASELSQLLQFLQQVPQAGPQMVAFGILGAMGQVFIFYTLSSFGALMLTTVCITRKFFSILLSVYLFNHSLTLMQWAGVYAVFVGLGFSVYDKYTRGRAKGKATPSGGGEASSSDVKEASSGSGDGAPANGARRRKQAAQ